MPDFKQVNDFFTQAGGVLKSFDYYDFFDIVFVAFVFYNAIKLVRGTRAIQLLKGIVFFAFVYFVISLFRMQASAFLFKTVAANAIMILVIIFSPEIRQALESMGRSGLSSVTGIGKSEREKNIEHLNNMITEVCRSVSDMSEKKIGALIVFERTTPLGSVIETGTTLDSVTSEELIGTIFFPKTPLHDGAAVVRDDRIVAAGCILPLTKNNSLNKELGTRHRAALGITEESDAVVVVVSEETGFISVAKHGVITRNVSASELRDKLQNDLIDNFENRTPSVFARLLERIKARRKGDKES